MNWPLASERFESVIVIPVSSQVPMQNPFKIDQGKGNDVLDRWLTNLHSEGRFEYADYRLWWMFLVCEQGENLAIRVKAAGKTY
jgi:hypothetical protein